MWGGDEGAKCAGVVAKGYNLERLRVAVNLDDFIARVAQDEPFPTESDTGPSQPRSAQGDSLKDYLAFLDEKHQEVMLGKKITVQLCALLLSL